MQCPEVQSTPKKTSTHTAERERDRESGRERELPLASHSAKHHQNCKNKQKPTCIKPISIKANTHDAHTRTCNSVCALVLSHSATLSLSLSASLFGLSIAALNKVSGLDGYFFFTFFCVSVGWGGYWTLVSESAYGHRKILKNKG